MKIPFKQWLQRAHLAIREFGPYLALVVLPGGAFIAFATWMYRHRTPGVRR